MATTQWLTTTKRDLTALSTNAVTIGLIAKQLVVFFQAAHERVPSPLKLEQTPMSAMETVVKMMIEKAMEFIEKNGDKLPHDEFSMQYHSLFLAVNREAILLYYQNGVTIPLGFTAEVDKDVSNKVELVTR